MNKDPYPEITERLTTENWKRKRKLSRLLILLSGTIISVFLTLSDTPALSAMPVTTNTTHPLSLVFALLLQSLSLGAGVLYYFLDAQTPKSQHRAIQAIRRDPNRSAIGPIPVTQSDILYRSQISVYTIQLWTFLFSYLCIAAYIVEVYL